MDWADYSLKIAPNVVALVVAVGSILWGRVVLQAKNDLLKMKDEQLRTVRESSAEVIKTKDAHVELLEHFRPARLLEDLDALHQLYALREKTIQLQADEKVAAIQASKTDDKEKRALEKQVAELRREVSQAQRSREAAEQLAAILRSSMLELGHQVTIGGSTRPTRGLYDTSGLQANATVGTWESVLRQFSSPSTVDIFGAPRSGDAIIRGTLKAGEPTETLTEESQIGESKPKLKPKPDKR